jgi:hypothetical protein
MALREPGRIIFSKTMNASLGALPHNVRAVTSAALQPDHVRTSAEKA